jgi:hypothetical protein
MQEKSRGGHTFGLHARNNQLSQRAGQHEAGTSRACSQCPRSVGVFDFKN